MSEHRILAARFLTPLPEDDREPLDRIFVRDLVVMASIGVHAHERLAPQRIRVNVQLEVRLERGALQDSIAKVVSYEDIVTGVKRLTAEEHINLVETLAERIAELCLTDQRAVRVEVRVEKLDIEPDAESVGVEITRLASPPSAKVTQLSPPERRPRKAKSGGED